MCRVTTNWCYRVSQLLVRLILAPFVRIHVWHAPGASGEEPTGATILVSNHISHFDPPVFTATFRRPIDWMTTQEFYGNRLVAAWLHSVNTFPVDRSRPDRRALRLGVERLRAGRLIGVFPEGGIRAGETSILGGAEPKGGATTLARLGGAPIVPCILFGSDRLYDAKRWRPWARRTPVWLAIGPPISVAGLSGEAADTKLVAAMRELGAQAVAHFGLEPDDLPMTPQRRKGRDAQVAN